MNKFIRSCFSLLLVICTLLSFTFSVGATELGGSIESYTAAPFYNITCSYNGVNSVKIEYRMKSKALKEYKDYTVSVYMLTPPYEIQDILSGKLEPLKTELSLSNRSSVDIKVSTLEARLSRYVLTVGNREELICSEPFYPLLDNSIEYSSGFKGIAGFDMSVGIESAAQAVIIDVDADKLEGRGSGYLHTVGGKTYIFNREYVEELDRKLTVYGGAGSDIYLRLYSAKDKSILIDGQASSLQSVYSYVSFLFSRYTSEKLKGMVIGKPKDTSDAALAQNYAAALYSAVAAVSDMGKKLTATVPVGDVRENTENFLSALCRTLEATGGPYFTVMLESDKNPKRTMQADLSSEYIAVENIEEFNSFLSRLNAEGGCVYTSMIYFWSPDPSSTYGSAAEAEYVYDYYKLFFLKSVAAMIVSLEQFEESDKDVSALKNAVRYINTNKRAEYIQDLRISQYFGFTDWQSEISGFSADKLNEKTLWSDEAITETPSDIIGHYDYFDFSSDIGIGSWYEGACCNSLTLSKNGFGKALAAKLDTNGKGTAFIAYDYKTPENFKHTDYISVSFSIDNIVSDSNLDFLITLGGNGFECDYIVKDVVPKTKYTVYLDVAQMNEKTTTENIRLSLKGNNGENAELYVYSIGAESCEYDSKKLLSFIESERERLNTESEQNETVNRFAIAFVVAAVLGTGVVMIMISRHKKKEQN